MYFLFYNNMCGKNNVIRTHLNTTVLVPEHVLVVVKDTRSEELVEWHEQDGHAQPTEESHAHLQVQQVEGDRELDGQAP